MERESLLATLVFFLGGLALQVSALWPVWFNQRSAWRQSEPLQWFALCGPAAAALTVVAWLVGWALSQPDPVPAHVGASIFIAAGTFGILGARAIVRAVQSLRQSPRAFAIATVGLWRPRIVVSPEFARSVDERALQAALAHERAHVLHRDPLRIWVAQFVTDLQWPWDAAQHRFQSWLATLEQARDDEARACGVEGADLAAAVLSSLRFQVAMNTPAATLTGRTDALPMRISRLLRPLAESSPEKSAPYLIVAAGLAIVWLAAVALGIFCGGRLIDSLLAISS